MVRAKFWVSAVQRHQAKSAEYQSGGKVTLLPVYSPNPEHENKKFWDATPQGEITMQISNGEAFKLFEANLGLEFYVDFTPAK